MPPTRKLSGQTATAPEVAPKSPEIPDWMQPADDTLPDTASGPRNTYAGQLQGDMRKRPELEKAGCKNGDWYISVPGQHENGDKFDTLIPLNESFRYFMVSASAFRTEMNEKGEVTSASKDFSDRAAGSEHIVAIVIIDTGKELIPAKIDFRRSQWKAGGAGIDGLKEARALDFPSKSPAHKIAATFPAPFGRMVTKVTWHLDTSKRNGKRYFTSEGEATPATAEDVAKLAKAMADEAFRAELDAAKKGYDYRVKMIERAAEKKAA